MKTRWKTLALVAAAIPLPWSLLADDEVLVTRAAPWSFHVQSTYNVQQHRKFRAAYEGANSLQNREETRGSFTGTAFFGRRLPGGAELYVNPEAIAGSGLSKVLELAGPPNGETYRVDQAKLRLTLARAFVRQTWNLGGPTEKIDDGPNQLAGTATHDRLVLTAGKFSGTDVLDDNSYAHDPRTQFNNWSIWDTATWDYAADTRGYSYGVAAQLTRGAWTGRLASMLEPREANGIHLDRDVRHARGDNFELEHDHALRARAGKLRGMLFLNHARMGSYREAIDQHAQGPDVTATRRKGRVKWGVGLNAEQEFSSRIGGFVRAGWNDGRTESWAFTEVERTAVIGVSIKPDLSRRADDRLGVALVENGIARSHRDYFASGGLGFMLGDGRLRYGVEHLIDAYYLCQVARSLAITGEVQHFAHLGFNRDRGPVTVYGARVHLQY
ncbi:MAG: hypothetical protein NVSMB68_01900 [Thermoanaerobaculia bacterium]